ncbi:MAG: hypothetical protein WCB02_32055, partial [Bradyrhizobium sp.]
MLLLPHQDVERLPRLAFVSLPCLFRRLLFGRKALELFGSVVLAFADRRISRLFARCNLLLQRARQGAPFGVILFGPRSRAFDGRKFFNFSVIALVLAGSLIVIRGGVALIGQFVIRGSRVIGAIV